MKVLCCFGLFFGKPNEKTKAEWVVFLKFEYIWMRKCDKMQTIFLLERPHLQSAGTTKSQRRVGTAPQKKP